MAKRFTSTEKWDDPWFCELSYRGKLLFCYLCDKCDIAGFYEKSDRLTSFRTGIPESEIGELYNELAKSVVIKEGWVFVKNFIRHQKNLPLSEKNPCHRSILEKLSSKKHLFSEVYKDLGLSRGYKAPPKGLQSPIGIGKGKDKGKGNGSSLKPLATIIPEDLKDDEASITDWMEYKKQMGKAYKPKGLEAFYRVFRLIPKEKRRESVDYCMANGWTGLFEKKEKSNGQQRVNGRSVGTDKFDGVAETIDL